MYRQIIHSIILVACLLPTYSDINAQSNGVVVNGKWADQVSISDVNGRPFDNVYSDINGTPYFISDYKLSKITLLQGRTFENVQARIDLVRQEVHFIASNNSEASMPAGSVKEITLVDSSKVPAIQYLFQTGFTPIDDQNEKNFYLYLSKGKISLIKSYRTKIITEKNEFTGETNKEFRTYEDLYFFTGVSIIKIKKDKSYILGILKNKSAEIEEYIKSNGLGFKSQPDLMKIIDYYNSLQ